MTAAAATPLLDVADIAHNFGGLQVLRGVNFGIPAGSLTGLIGPNGAGKSTLFNIVSGFLLPRQGTVRYEGRDVTRDSVQARSRAGLVRTFQTPKVFPNLSVRENLMAGFYRHTTCGLLSDMLRSAHARRESERMHAQAESACDKFGLRDVFERQAGKLPAGLQRLIELARAYVSQPRLLMLDEPSSGLNSAEIEQLRAALLQLNREGMSILLVSHDMDLVTIASRVHVLCFGSIIASGAMHEIKQDERVRQAYLGV
jgi:branched-chain amino acid transport system ATP-binding protein/nonpolar-amino-acid-transporting ATPase